MPMAIVTMTAEDEHGVGAGRPDPEVWDDREFEQGRHHRADRSE